MSHREDRTAPITREACSREVIGSGCRFGDPAFPEPALCSCTAPEPDGPAGEPLPPDPAFRSDRGGSHLAVLRYDCPEGVTESPGPGRGRPLCWACRSGSKNFPSTTVSWTV